VLVHIAYAVEAAVSAAVSRKAAGDGGLYSYSREASGVE
jgi:hypothetical protein